MSLGLRFVGYDEGNQTLGLYHTDQPGPRWQISLAELPLARDLQRLGPDRALVGFDRGWFEVEISTGAVLSTVDRWKDVTSVRRLDNGETLVTGLNLAGLSGIVVLTVAPDGAVTRIARRDGDYVRMLRPTASGTYLLCVNDHILETRTDLSALRRLEAPGFRHAWLTHRYPDGSTLVAGGYGGFFARFDPEGTLTTTFGAAGQTPGEVAPNFWAAFQVLDDGRIAAANWQGHGPGNGAKGRQLVVFSPEGQVLDSWSDPGRISSLQGLLVV